MTDKIACSAVQQKKTVTLWALLAREEEPEVR